MSQGTFVSLYESEQPFALIDTRERRDHVNGHWFGSTNIPLSVLSAKITLMVPDRNFPIYLLDWQDKASDAAAGQLTSLGYQYVTRCKTSAATEFAQGYVKGEFVWSKAFGEVVAHTSGLPEITPADYLADWKDARLFDVRPTAEYTQFTIPGSHSLPNSLLLANMEALKQTGQPALLHCAGRTRSIIGACTLKAAGYEGPFAIFKGGTQAWQLDGLEREFNANTLFARETDKRTPVTEFLKKWSIHYEAVDNTELSRFIDTSGQSLLFDVSDDAATGQLAEHNIIKISGTNLIQQTDQSIACYHVPVILFDNGSGSRAAFAAYWLATMGFSVSVALLTESIASSLPAACDKQHQVNYDVLSSQELLRYRKNAGRIFDFRPSQTYSQESLTESCWANISELLVSDAPPPDDIVVIANTVVHASETAEVLQSHGWKIASIYAWNTQDIDPDFLKTSTINAPIDQSALFAGRHHGNMQDSRDYLAWEEALPTQIDELILQRWHKHLQRSAV